MSDPLDGWEFVSTTEHIEAEGYGYLAYIFRDGRVDVGVEAPLPTLRAVLDELERRARAKWGDGWGLPPGTCPRCKGSGMIHSREIVTHVMRLGDPDFAPPQSGYRVDPCPECSPHENAPEKVKP